MHVTVGTAPDSWGVWFADEPRQTPWRRFLDEAREAGYDWIELGPLGYLPTDPEVLAPRARGARSLQVSAGFIMRRIEAEDAPGADARGPGSARAAAADARRELPRRDRRRLHRPLHRRRPSTPGSSTTTAGGASSTTCRPWPPTRATASACGRSSTRTPRRTSSTSTRSSGCCDDTDPALVGVCLDTGHHAYRGGDPVAFLRQHADRIPYLHVKSVDPDDAAAGRGGGHPVRARGRPGHVLRAVPGRRRLRRAAGRAAGDRLRRVRHRRAGHVPRAARQAAADRPPHARRTCGSSASGERRAGSRASSSSRSPASIRGRLGASRCARRASPCGTSRGGVSAGRARSRASWRARSRPILSTDPVDRATLAGPRPPARAGAHRGRLRRHRRRRRRRARHPGHHDARVQRALRRRPHAGADPRRAAARRRRRRRAAGGPLGARGRATWAGS